MATSFNGKNQISTFTGGMNMDYDESVIPNNSYRIAENIRLVTNKVGDNGSIQAIEGMSSFSNGGMEYNYLDFDENTGFTSIVHDTITPNTHKIIGLGTIRDYTCIFTKNLIVGGNDIFRLVINNNDYLLTRIVSGNFNINNNEDKDISIVTYWEDVDNIKIYWADGRNSLRSINIAPDSDIINFNKSPEFFDNNISIGTEKPLFDSFIPGNLTAGMIQYAYQLFDVNGSETRISPLSDLIHLTKSKKNDINYEGTEKDESSNKSCKIKFKITDNKFSKCKIFRIHYTDAASLPKIYIASEFDIALTTEGQLRYQYYSDNGVVLDEITYEEFITSDPYSFIPKIIESKDGRLFAGDIIEDTWNLPDHTSDDWFDTRSFRFAKIGNKIQTKLESLTGDTKIISYSELTSLDNSEWKDLLPYNHDCINPINRNSSLSSRDNSSYEWFTDGRDINLKGGVGRNISYKIIHTKFGEDYYESSDLSRSSFRDRQFNEFSGHSRNVSIVNDSNKNDTALGFNYNIPLQSDNNYESENFTVTEEVKFNSIGSLNYSNAYLDAKYRSYQRDETYRFGIIFYNKRGQSTPVNWIGDIRMPSMLEKEHRLFDQWDRIISNRYSNTYDVYQVVTYPMGLLFELNNMPNEVHQYEIVRCKRTFEDRSIAFQGLIGRTGRKDNITRPLIVDTYSDSLRQYYNTAATYYDPGNAAINVNNSVTDYSKMMNDSKDIYTFNSSEISYFGELISNYSNSILGVNILYGMSSPTRVITPERGSATIRDLYNKIRDTMVHVFNSQQWYDNDLNDHTVTDSQNHLLYSDGSINRFKNEGRSIMMRGYQSTTSQNGPINENKSKLVAKLYNPFTMYTGVNGLFDTANENLHVDVSDIKYADGLPFDSYEDVRNGLHSIAISDSTFQNWSIDKYVIGTTDRKTKHGAHGPCLILKIPRLKSELPYITSLGARNDGGAYSSYYRNSTIKFSQRFNSGWEYGLGGEYEKSTCYAANATFLVNLYKTSNMYGGEDYNSRTLSTYISTGAFISNDNINKNSVVFGGDTYIGINEYVQQHWYYLKSDPDPGITQAWDKIGEKSQIVNYYPCESSINMSMVHGSNFNKYANLSTYPKDIQLESGTMISGFTQEKNLYSYNSIYSTEMVAREFLPKGVYTEDRKAFDYRIIYSDKKTNDEISDNWLKFKVANYLDLDTRFGSINNMKLFNNSLFFWQTDAFGELPVNERSLITDNNDAQLLLGTGDVLQYYKYITQSNGSRDGVINNIAVSPSNLYWHDHDRKEIMSFSDSLKSLSKHKNIQSWFNHNGEDIENKMTTLYDKKYNEVHFNFNIPNKTGHLIFGEQSDCFTSFYTYKPDWFIDLKDSHFAIKDLDLFKLNSNKLLNMFFNSQQESNISYIVNDSHSNTKVFDRVEFHGEQPNNKNITEFQFVTNSNNSHIVKKEDVDKREDTYRFAIPRDKNNIISNNIITPNQGSRIKGKHMISNMKVKFDINSFNFSIPYINTIYRMSNI